MLTCDAFGVLPPDITVDERTGNVSLCLRLHRKVVGTERGVTEPSATFSACLGAPFMALPPSSYATLLGEKVAKHQVQTWLINTGWSGGACGQGQRIKLSLTRAMISASFPTTSAVWKPETTHKLRSCRAGRMPNVPSEILDPAARGPTPPPTTRPPN